MKFRITALALCLIASAAIAQTTRLVPSQYPTIQSAIAASINGDTVLVSPGTYPGSITFLGKAIGVSSTNGALVTTIVGTGGTVAVTFASNEGSASILTGFTVTGSGGVFIHNASPTIQNCRIVNNVKIGVGAGVLCASTGASTASPTLSGCNIDSNLAANSVNNLGGGGIAFDGQSSAMSFPTILNCTISSNIATNGLFGTTGAGGGLVVSGRYTAAFFGCSILNNSTSNVGGGCHVNTPNASASFTSCKIAGNHSSGTAGGAFHVGSGNLSMIGCLVVGNSCTSTGGVIYAGNSSSEPPQTIFVKNCTITNNVAAGAIGGISVFGTGAPIVTVTNTILWGNSGTDLQTTAASVTYSVVGLGLYTPGVGTSNVDPLFLDSANDDFHISSISPCRDAGAPGTTGLPATDIDGVARIVGTNVDIGADELPLITYPGTGDGLDLYAWINGSGDPLGSTRPAVAGNLLTVLTKSATGTLVGGNPVFAAQLYVNGAPPFVFLPTVWTDSAAVIVYGDFAAPPFGFPGLPPEGLEFNFTVPAGLAGTTLRMQGFVISLNSLNGIFATTNATEVTF